MATIDSGIDELLRNGDRSLRQPSKVPTRPAAVAAATDDSPGGVKARAAASRARTPVPSAAPSAAAGEGNVFRGGAKLARAGGTTAAASVNAQPLGAAGEKVFGDTATRASPGTQQPLSGRQPTVVQSGTLSRLGASPVPPKLAGASKLARGGAGLAEGLVPGAAIAASADAFKRPTEDYYNRFGLDPNGVGINGFKDLAVRTGGVVSDVGAGVLDLGTGAVNAGLKFAGKEPLQTFGEILRQNDNPAEPATAGTTAATPAAAPLATAGPAAAAAAAGDNGGRVPQSIGANLPGISIVPGANDPTRQANAKFFAGEAAARETREKERGAINLAQADAIRTRSSQQEAIKTLTSALAQSKEGFQGRTEKANSTELAVALANLQAGLSGGTGAETAAKIQAQGNTDAGIGAGLADAQAKTAGTEAETEAKNLGNEAAKRQQALLQSIGALPEDATAAARRGLIDQALVGSGKDPDAGRFAIVDSPSADGLTSLKTAIDTRTGQVVGGGGQNAAPAGEAAIAPPPSAINALKNGVKDNPQLLAQFEAKYGKGSAAAYLER